MKDELEFGLSSIGHTFTSYPTLQAFFTGGRLAFVCALRLVLSSPKHVRMIAKRFEVVEPVVA